MLDPIVQRAAINALEVQRAAYQRFTKTLEAQAQAVGTGDAEHAESAANTAARGVDELQVGATALRPHLDQVRQQGSAEQQAEIQRRMDALSGDADRAQGAIQNLTAQLDAWRTAYGRQLAAVGLTPGGNGGSATDPTTGARASDTTGTALATTIGAARAHDTHGYGPRGQATTGHRVPTLLNRLG